MNKGLKPNSAYSKRRCPFKRNTDLMNKGLKPAELHPSVTFSKFKRNTDLMNKGLKQV